MILIHGQNINRQNQKQGFLLSLQESSEAGKKEEDKILQKPRILSLFLYPGF